MSIASTGVVSACSLEADEGRPAGRGETFPKDDDEKIPNATVGRVCTFEICVQRRSQSYTPQILSWSTD